MRMFDARTIVGFTVGAGMAIACTVAGASFAQPPTARAQESSVRMAAPAVAMATPLTTTACADKKTGAVTIVGKKHKKCTKAEKSIRFATQVTPTPSILGSDGSLKLAGKVQLTSPNGEYVLVLTDNGLGLKGPGGTIAIDPYAVVTEQTRKAP